MLVFKRTCAMPDLSETLPLIMSKPLHLHECYLLPDQQQAAELLPVLVLTYLPQDFNSVHE